ncbi:helix-turn-helix domain-containing protein [Maricaulis salignorans]|uniref:DnaA protein helix-turn-helix n=1 Tax=Maricaulis salignorans TaxID=144026 RepID=A0A1G9Q4U3_9PROT|nr:helix-turn-helix domain-containing protein [Maricaulis salignorans]SDM06074.1 dnaA protein helix-turn-helix [Maricaulis salignorans]
MTQAMTRTGSDAARARLAQSAVAYAFGVTQDDLEAPTRRSREAAFARQAAMYLAHVAFELSLTRVAQAFGRDRSTAAHACHRIEDQRDDRGFDQYMDALEACLRAAPCPGEPD